ncbi:putative ABC transport system permease protein [Dysgonomonas alginatilytica]|uniref:Putative ABC transport system permease protein n=1 Tax=Dysgonomonas alginatilytica TaxID=1605892 RepID=A0A2V3PSA7_9BACT|nr:ABC transporter permease [Dysgonomonas alginatilytica]PXV68060.1 putative ABC transport system permease protein [Dysgonomonas alginatilytica]
MFDLDKWQEIWSTITANKMRSVMTGFGVFWGIFMLVFLIGAGNALEGGMEQNIKGFARNSGFFWTNATSEPYKGYRKGRSWNMNNRDLEIIRQKATALEYISPMLFGGSSSKNVVIGRKSTSAQVMGVYPDQFKIQTQTIIRGRLFNDLDIRKVSKVALIGKTVAENLFDSGQNPIGAYIRVNGIYFQVVGVIRPNSKAQIGADAETSVFIPFSTMQKAFNQGDIIHFMGATAKPGVPVSVLEDQIKTILKTNHSIAPNDDKAARSVNVEKEFQTFANLFLGIRSLIWIVGLGSLLSGIIGVSNIMLVTVRERTREIGVRRALGAKPMAIVSQIVSESFVLTFIAGFAGLFFGVVILEMISTAMRGGASEDMFFIPPFISFGTAIISMTILISSGLFAGLIPALRALSIKAIDAIREE